MPDLIYPYTDVKVNVFDLVVILNMPGAEDLYISGIYVVRGVTKRSVLVEGVRSGQQFDLNKEEINRLRLVRPKATDIRNYILSKKTIPFITLKKLQRGS